MEERETPPRQFRASANKAKSVGALTLHPGPGSGNPKFSKLTRRIGEGSQAADPFPEGRLEEGWLQLRPEALDLYRGSTTASAEWRGGPSCRGAHRDSLALLDPLAGDIPTLRIAKSCRGSGGGEAGEPRRAERWQLLESEQEEVSRERKPQARLIPCG